MRHASFDRARRQRFLDVQIAARREMNAAFADGFQEALQLGYRLLEAEAVRQQRAAQEAYRIAPDPDVAAQARSFGEVMPLLREYHRGQGEIGRRPTDRRRPAVASNAEVRAALSKGLAAFHAHVHAGEAEPPAPAA